MGNEHPNRLEFAYTLVKRVRQACTAALQRYHKALTAWQCHAESPEPESPGGTSQGLFVEPMDATRLQRLRSEHMIVWDEFKQRAISKG
jgi:hypothetical protein